MRKFSFSERRLVWFQEGGPNGQTAPPENPATPELLQERSKILNGLIETCRTMEYLIPTNESETRNRLVRDLAAGTASINEKLATNSQAALKEIEGWIKHMTEVKDWLVYMSSLRGAPAAPGRTEEQSVLDSRLSSMNFRQETAPDGKVTYTFELPAGAADVYVGYATNETNQAYSEPHQLFSRAGEYLSTSDRYTARREAIEGSQNEEYTITAQPGVSVIVNTRFGRLPPFLEGLRVGETSSPGRTETGEKLLKLRMMIPGPEQTALNSAANRFRTNVAVQEALRDFARAHTDLSAFDLERWNKDANALLVPLNRALADIPAAVRQNGTFENYMTIYLESVNAAPFILQTRAFRLRYNQRVGAFVWREESYTSPTDVDEARARLSPGREVHAGMRTLCAQLCQRARASVANLPSAVVGNPAENPEVAVIVESLNRSLRQLGRHREDARVIRRIQEVLAEEMRPVSNAFTTRATNDEPIVFRLEFDVEDHVIKFLRPPSRI